MIRNKKILTGLDHSQYEHPFDQKALKALKATPGLSMVGNFIAKHMIEKVYTVQYTGSNLKVTKDNYPKIYEYLQYACEILDMKRCRTYIFNGDMILMLVLWELKILL